MSTAIVLTRAISALNAPCVTVETHLSGGLPAFNLVGLPETAVRESKERVRSAIINSDFDFPNKRITINLAPADLPKDGGRYDVAIALSILAASGQIPQVSLDQYEFLGELALTGGIRPVSGVLGSSLSSHNKNRLIVVPEANGPEARLAVKDGHRVAGCLQDICAHLQGNRAMQACKADTSSQKPAQFPDMDEIQGQELARRALEITAAGGHNLLYEGPPGCGKSMLAQRLPGILPDLTEKEALSLLAIHSILSKGIDTSHWMQRPFRAPHHSASTAAMVGGGNPPKPGEISLAHQGVLFLDEFPEFPRSVMESLREPMENGYISISRASQQAVYPARFQLIAAMNPCPCGYYGDQVKTCHCSPDRVQRYRDRISGPIMDRIDMHVTLQPTPLKLLGKQASTHTESSTVVRARVTSAREKQIQRQKKPNAQLNGNDLQTYALLTTEATDQLYCLADRLALSARAFQRVIRVSRTIADLENSEAVHKAHIMEACSYRQG